MILSPHCATAASSTLAEHVKDEEIVERSEAATVVPSVAFPDTVVVVSSCSPLDDAAVVVVELDDAAVVVVVELDAAAVVVVVAPTVVVVVVVVMP
jgi:hypothetical protein